MSKIVISVERGRIQRIFGSDSEANLMVVDWGTDGHLSSDREMVRVRQPAGERFAHVARWAPEPLEDLVGSEIAAALAAADHLQPFSRAEVATMLAALRAWQSALRREGENLLRANPHFDEQPPLDEAQIDALCARLNEPLPA